MSVVSRTILLSSRDCEANAPRRSYALHSTASSFKPKFEELKSTASTSAAPFPEGIISLPKPLELKLDGKIVYAVYYSPTNPAYAGDPEFELGEAVFHKQRYAWLDVNYGGSSCYGRAYVERLKGNWGITDVKDCIDAVESPELSLLIDAKRTAIRGGSAGKQEEIFASATSSYGISNMEVFADDTHKFELKYVIKLFGGTKEEIPDVYHDRSPEYFSANIKTPLLVLQGNDDEIVPPVQAWPIINGILKTKGHVEAHFFDGEQHGWRRSETMKKAIEFEREWYEKMMVRTTISN
ncbi:Alpha/Beta hydrolase protein [Suillus ampliporus]|nr:Alpha/Beta hydrolase protein [Suillus ampliporus]